MNQDCVPANQGHFRRIDLTPVAGSTMDGNAFVETVTTTAANTSWTVKYGAYAIVGADGVVHPIFIGMASGQTPSFSVWNQTGATSPSYSIDHSACGTCYDRTTSYYHGDPIGSSRLMTSGGGWPIWQGAFCRRACHFSWRC